MRTRPLETPEYNRPTTITVGQAVGVLNSLSEAVAEFDTRNGFKCRFANSAFCELVNQSPIDISGAVAESIFSSPEWHSVIPHLQTAVDLQPGDKVVAPELIHLGNGSFQVRITKNDKAILTVFIETGLPDTAGEKAASLDAQARQLMLEARSAGAGNTELKEEISRLYKRLQHLEKHSDFDVVSGFQGRASFMEKAAAEFQRCTRYQHHLSMVIVQIDDIETFDRMYGKSASDQAMTALGQLIESSYRMGTDVGGRISSGEIAILMPETSLEDALQYLQRLKKSALDSPVLINDLALKLPLVVCAESVQENDHTALQVLTRCLAGLNIG